MKNYLNFETDIKKIEDELEKLKDPYQEGLTEVNTQKSITTLLVNIYFLLITK